VTKELNKELDGTYTRLLRQTLNINWIQHITNEELYADLTRISETIKERRFRLAGHCWRSNEAAANLVLWKPQHWQKKPGRPKLDYATLLSEDTGLNVVELGTISAAYSAAFSNFSVWICSPIYLSIYSIYLSIYNLSIYLSICVYWTILGALKASWRHLNTDIITEWLTASSLWSCFSESTVHGTANFRHRVNAVVVLIA